MRAKITRLMIMMRFIHDYRALIEIGETDFVDLKYCKNEKKISVNDQRYVYAC